MYCSVTHEEGIVCNYSILHSLDAVSLNGLIKSPAFPQNVKTTIQKKNCKQGKLFVVFRECEILFNT